MHRWPSVTPWNLETLPLHWWVYLIRSAKREIEERKRATEKVKGARRGR